MLPTVRAPTAFPLHRTGAVYRLAALCSLLASRQSSKALTTHLDQGHQRVWGTRSCLPGRLREVGECVQRAGVPARLQEVGECLQHAGALTRRLWT